MPIKPGYYPDCTCGQNKWHSIRYNSNDEPQETLLCLACERRHAFVQRRSGRASFIMRSALPYSRERDDEAGTYMNRHVQAIWADYTRRYFDEVRRQELADDYKLRDELGIPHSDSPGSLDMKSKEQEEAYRERYGKRPFRFETVPITDFADEPKFAKLPDGLVAFIGRERATEIEILHADSQIPRSEVHRWKPVSHVEMASLEIPVHPVRLDSERHYRELIELLQSKGVELAFREIYNVYDSNKSYLSPWYVVGGNSFGRDFTIVMGQRRQSHSVQIGRYEPFDDSELSSLAEKHRSLFIRYRRDETSFGAYVSGMYNRVEIRSGGQVAEVAEYLLAMNKIIG